VNLFQQAIRTAKEKAFSSNGDPDYMSGGFDIMKKLVKKQRKNMPVRKFDGDGRMNNPLDQYPEPPFAR
jgi:hypothetical protein